MSTRYLLYTFGKFLKIISTYLLGTFHLYCHGNRKYVICEASCTCMPSDDMIQYAYNMHMISGISFSLLFQSTCTHDNFKSTGNSLVTGLRIVHKTTTCYHLTPITTTLVISSLLILHQCHLTQHQIQTS